MYKVIQVNFVTFLFLLCWGCAEADYLDGQGISGAPRTGSTSTGSDDSNGNQPQDADTGDEDPGDDSHFQGTGQAEDKDGGQDTDVPIDTGAPVDTGAAVDTVEPQDSGTAVEPDTDFKCVNDLQCTLKWFGTICCDNRCINPLIHPKHCGSCQNDCTADKRGNNCAMGSCVCGPIPGVVCLGEDEGQCCKKVPLVNIFACDQC